MTSTRTSQRRYFAQSAEGTPLANSAGLSIDDAAPLGEQIASGPLLVRSNRVIFGADATEMLLNATGRNQSPAEGMIHVIANISIENTGDRAITVDNDDFGFVTEMGRVWRSVQIEPPEPAINTEIEPGQVLEGWVAGQVEDGAQSHLMIFNPRDLGGDWATRYIMLTNGSTMALPVESTEPANQVGVSVVTPARLGEVTVTADWGIAITEVRFADDVVALFPPEDYRTTALASAAPEVIPSWIAFHIELQQVRSDGKNRHFPVDALNLAGDDGGPIEDVRILSSPFPDLSGDYLPGARGSGWYLFELPIGHPGTTLRFQPWRSDADVRFISWGEQIATPDA